MRECARYMSLFFSWKSRRDPGNLLGLLGNNPNSAGRGRIGKGGIDGDISIGSAAGESAEGVTAVGGEAPTKEFGVEGTARIDAEGSE